MFTHFQYDVRVGPLPELAPMYKEAHEKDPEVAKKYPDVSSFDILMEELNATNMVVS